MLSVVLPTYNVQRYIDRCIKSLLKQTNRNFEIVFIDDGSTDKSAEIIKKYQNKNKNIKLIQLNKNIGTFHARKIGARKASGRYIIFLDPDDELKSEMVERFYQLISSKSPDMVFFGVEYIPKKKWFQGKKHHYPFNKDERAIKRIHSGRKIISHGTPGKAYKKTFLENIYSWLDIDEGFRFTYAEDMLLFYASILKNPKTSTLSYQGYVYYTNESSITNKSVLKNPHGLIYQLDFTISKIKNLLKEVDLNSKELLFMTKLLDQTAMSQRYLMLRYDDNGKNYLKKTMKALSYQFSINQIIRIVIYILSLKRIKI